MTQRYSNLTQKGYKNVLFNGNFERWPDGLGPYTATLATHTALMCKVAKSGSGAYSVTASNTSKPNDNCNYVHNMSVTTAEASVDPGDYAVTIMYAEGIDFVPFLGQVATLSFWVRASVIGTYCVSFRNNDKDRSFVHEYTINQADTWEYKTITLTFNSDGTWNKLSGNGIDICWTMMVGSTYQTGTTDAWVTGNYLGTSNQVNGANTIGNSFQLSQCQLELGSVATDFEELDIMEFTRMCERYWQQVESDHRMAVSVTVNTGIAYCNFQLPTDMRATPSVVSLNTKIWNPNVGWRNTSSITNSASTNRCLTILYDNGYTGYQSWYNLLIQGTWQFDARL